MQAYLTKTQSGFVPADPDTEVWYKKRKFGEVVQGEFKTIRNYEFLKKFFALLNVGFDNWEPGHITSEYGWPEKNFEKFREDVTILAGYFYVVIRLDGSTQVKAKSISFAKMEEEEFSELYNKAINVLLKHVYDSDMTPKALKNIVNQYMGFT